MSWICNQFMFVFYVLAAQCDIQMIGPSSPPWDQVVEAVIGLESIHAQSTWLATFDVDGTLIREKPSLLEVDWALFALCSRSIPAIVPPRLAGLCNGTTAIEDLAYPEEVYALLLLPFAGWSMDAYQASAVNWLRSQSNIVYAGMAELISMLIKRGWRVLLVSQTMSDTLRALATAYDLKVHGVLGSAPMVTLNADLHSVLFRGTQVHGPLLNGDEKVQRIWESEGRLPLVAVGNSAGDLSMLRSAAFGIVIDHTSSIECVECSYPVWLVRDDLRHNVSTYGWQVVTVDDLPRPLFQQTQDSKAITA